jgi:UTP--glucose-1-phosphate uridylyltransferase
MPRVRKAVIPAAGLGTRFLPATKAIPKEMLPVIDVPAIQYVVEEAVAAGMHDVLMVTGRGKGALEDHFDAAPELESRLDADGKDELLARVRASSELADMHFVRQRHPRGLGHAVLCGAEHVGDEAFGVLLGDDLIDPRNPILPRMVEVAEQTGGCVVALLEVPRETIKLYGSAAVEPTAEEGVVRITDLVEKPDPDEAPSNFAVIGRYVLSPQIFDALRETPPGRGNEIQLTDAIQRMIDRTGEGGPVHGVVFDGLRYDTGDKIDYLKATVQLACERTDIGPAFSAWLRDYAGALS